MNAVISWLVARLAEPSTWAGVALVATGVKQLLAGDTAGATTSIGGLLAMLIPEGKSASASPSTTGGK